MDFECSVSFVATVLVTLFFIYLLGTWSYDFFENRSLPFVKPLPFVGNLGPFVMRKRSFAENMEDLYKQFKGHRMAGYFEFLSPVTMILDPELIRQITVKHFDHFVDHKLPIREDADPMFGKSLFALQGERWRDMRHTLSPAFTSSKMKTMIVLVRQTGTQLGHHVEQLCQAQQGGLVTLELRDLFNRYETDVIFSTAFGVHCDSLKERDNEFHRVGKDVTNFEGKVGLIAIGYHFSAKLMKLLKLTFVSKKNADFFRSLVHDTMVMRERENIVRPDMIQLLMQAKKGKLRHDVTDDPSETVSSIKDAKVTELSDDDVTAQALLFLMAGFESSTTLLCFVSHLLTVHPVVQRRVQQEIDDILQEDDGVLTYEGCQRMTYLDMVISETLRLYPPAVWAERLCTKSFTIDATDSNPAVVIAKGEGVLLPTYAIQRDPDYFPDPTQFNPERFSEENKHNITPFTYMPFGAGPRACIGMRFALMTVKVALVSLLSRFDLEVVPKTTIPLVLNRKLLHMNIQGGFWIGITPRIDCPL